MRVVKVKAPAQPGWQQAISATERTSHLERLGLAVTSVVMLLGLWLTYAAQTADFGEARRDLASGHLFNLNAIARSSDLVPALDMFDQRAQKEAVAAAIVQRVQRGPDGEAIEHVGALAGVPGLKAADLAALKPRFVVRTPVEFRRQAAIAVGLFMFCFWLAHAVRWRFGTTGDPVLLPAIHLLTGLGLMAMIALRDPLRDTFIAGVAAQGIAGGCALWTALSFIDFERPRLRRAVLAPLGMAVLLATALLAFGGGPTGSGAKVNLLGGQPVEAIRLLVVFSLAAYFARRWQFLREFSTNVHLGTENSGRAVRVAARLPRWKDVRPLVISITALLALFFLQRDLGPALVISCVFLGLYGIARARVPLLLCGFAALTAGFAAGYLLGIPATLTRRVAIAVDPWDNALPGGDQIAHALWAMSSGGLWGLGPGVGDPQLIPAGHTDLVIAAIGEELGLIGVMAIIALSGIVIWRLLSISIRAPGDYTLFLTVGLTLAVAAQGVVIVAGVLGLLPLAGVVTPFLSYGRSAMLSNFIALGVCAAIARRRGAERVSLARPVRVLGWTLAATAVLVMCRTVDVQAVRGDGYATRANLTQQADGGYRYQYNPRLLIAARDIVRGTIYDRSGLPLATSRPKELAAFADQFRRLGIGLPNCPRQRTRCYPLGGLAFHVLGDGAQQTNWAAGNVSYVEQDFDAHLKGFDDHPEGIDVTNPRTGRIHVVIRRNYRELLPLVRHKDNPGHAAVRRLLARSRDLHITLDAGLQVRTAQTLRLHAQRANAPGGAAIVLDPLTGNLLASVSYPWPETLHDGGDVTASTGVLLDRARYGLYPPGSTFKLITAAAAFRSNPAAQHSTFQCARLPDGRVGGRVRGAAKPIRDDPLDTHPHGTVDLHRALVVSCNAYFSHLAERIGASALSDAAAAAQIAAASPPVRENLRRNLPYAGYGQGEVLASPLRMARVAGAVTAGGILRDVRLKTAPGPPSAGVRWLSADAANKLRQYMREVVTSGTGRALAHHPIAVAGKTGTAEVDRARSHSWFVGFAPYDPSTARQIAFAVVVEHAGYGARVAAPIAGDIVSAAHARGLIR